MAEVAARRSILEIEKTSVTRVCSNQLSATLSDTDSFLMRIKGCGKRNVSLTFYVVEPKSRDRVEEFACGQRVEATVGRGILLCAACAAAYGLLKTSRRRVQRAIRLR